MRANQTLRYFAARITELPHLTLREKEILFKRLDSKTLEEIGKKHGLTAERIRQIEQEALEKVKSKTRQLGMFKD